MEGTMQRLRFVAMGVFALVLAFGITTGFAQQAHAADYTAGSIKTQSTTSSSKKVVKGTIKSGSKVVKTFTMPKEGFVTFTVKVPRGLGSTAVRIDYHSIRFVSTNVSNGSLGSGTFTSGRYTIKPGGKFRVTLELPDSILKQSLPYTITMTSKKPANYESELNNSKNTANALTLDKACSGNIMKKGLDWFVFKAPKDGTYKFLGKTTLFTDGTSSFANMAVYQGSSLCGFWVVSNGNGYSKLGSVTLKKGEKAYVKVTPALLSTSDSVSYALKACQDK